MTEPLVSIILVTYNHAAYVRDAIAGIFAQDVSFGHEILICEDCSTDGTREMVVTLQQEHPERIRLFLTERNQNDNDVFTRAWQVARGRYIAYLDGDDYWTDPGKLGKQVAFLEQHPEVFVCGHAVRQIDHTGKVLKESKFDIYSDVELSPEVMASGLGCPLPALSVLFRNNGRLPPSRVFNKVFNADTFMFAFFANFGGGFVSREIMGVHRVHPGSVWSLLDDKRSADLRNSTIRRIPRVITPRLRAVSYWGLLQHSRFEDYRLSRKLRDIPVAVVMMAVWLRWQSALFLVPPRYQKWVRAAWRLFHSKDAPLHA